MYILYFLVAVGGIDLIIYVVNLVNSGYFLALISSKGGDALVPVAQACTGRLRPGASEQRSTQAQETPVSERQVEVQPACGVLTPCVSCCEGVSHRCVSSSP